MARWPQDAGLRPTPPLHRACTVRTADRHPRRRAPRGIPRTLHRPSWPCPPDGLASRARRTSRRRRRPSADQEDLPNVDLGDVARLLLLVFILPVLDTALDVELVALLHVALDDVGEARALAAGVPGDALVPLGLLLLFAGRRVPLARGREREVRDLAAVGRRADFGIVPEVPDEHDFVQAAAHNSSSLVACDKCECTSRRKRHQIRASMSIRVPEAGCPASGFRLPASAPGFRLPASGFRLPASKAYVA